MCHFLLLLILSQKVRTMLNSDDRRMPQAFKGHSALSCPSELKAFSGIQSTSVMSTFPRQEGIYIPLSIKVLCKRLLYPFSLAISTPGFPGSTIWNDLSICIKPKLIRITKRRPYTLTHTKKNQLAVNCRIDFKLIFTTIPDTGQIHLIQITCTPRCENSKWDGNQVQ